MKYSPVEIEELIGAKGKPQIGMRSVPLERISEYACEDADLTLQLKKILEQKLLDFLKEDIDFGDITTDYMPDKHVKAHIVAKEPGFICGLEFAQILLESVGLEVSNIKNDGDQVSPGTIILEIEGSSKLILVVERTILNFLMRLSGITTQTRKLVKVISKSKNTFIEYSSSRILFLCL